LNINSSINKSRTQPTAQARLRLDPHTEASTHKHYAVLQSVFIVMVFVADTHCSTFIFLKCKKKIKELQANTQNKNPRQKKLPEAK
jgi:hypothetical protein